MSPKQRTSPPAAAKPRRTKPDDVPAPAPRTPEDDAFDEAIQEIFYEIKEDVAPGTPYSVTEAIAIQLYTAREARKRIEREGSVVRDMKGSVIPHPAIGVESAAMKLYVDWIGKNTRRPRFAGR